MLKLQKNNFLIFSHILSIIVFVFFKKKIFYIFPQAMNIYNLHVGIITLCKNGYIHHIPRYLVVYPSIFLGELFKINIHLVNTVYSLIIFIVTIILWWKIIKKYKIKINLLTWICLVSFSIIINFVNGRIFLLIFQRHCYYIILLKKNFKLT